MSQRGHREPSYISKALGSAAQCKLRAPCAAIPYSLQPPWDPSSPSAFHHPYFQLVIISMTLRCFWGQGSIKGPCAPQFRVFSATTYFDHHVLMRVDIVCCSGVLLIWFYPSGRRDSAGDSAMRRRDGHLVAARLPIPVIAGQGLLVQPSR